MEQVLRTERLDLEPLTVEHAPRLFGALQENALYTYIPGDAPPSVDWLHEKYTRWSRRGNEAGDQVWLNYALLERARGVYVGTVQATVLAERQALLAYQVFPHAWRRGIAKEACAALLRVLRESFAVETVRAHVDTRNAASCALLASLGFARVSTIEAADTFKGAVSDEFVYELPTGAS